MRKRLDRDGQGSGGGIFLLGRVEIHMTRVQDASEDFQQSRACRSCRAGFAVFVFALILALSPVTSDPANDAKYLVLHVGAAILVLLVLNGARRGRLPLRRPALLRWPLTMLMATYILAAVTSDHPINSLMPLFRYVALLALYWAASQVFHHPAHFRGFLIVFCGATAISSVYGFFQHAGLDPFPWLDEELSGPEYRGLPGTFGNPNLAGHAMVLATFGAVYLLLERKHRWALLLLFLYGAHMYFMRHRASLVALVAGGVLVAAALLLMSSYVSRKRPGVATATAVLCTIILAVVGAAGAIVVSNARTGSPLPMDASLQLRYNSFYGATRMIVAQPWLGYGPGNYEIENPPFWTPLEQENFAFYDQYNRNVHNELLETTVDAGFLAAVAYLGLFAVAVCGSLYLAFQCAPGQHRRTYILLAAIFTGFFVDSMFGFNLHAPSSAALLFIAAGVLESAWQNRFTTTAYLSERRLPYGARVFAALAIAGAVMGGLCFYGEFQFLRAMGASAWRAYPIAEANLIRAQRLEPWNWRIAYFHGLMKVEQREWASAEQYFLEALEKHPYHVPSMIGLATTYVLNMEATGFREEDGMRAIEALNDAVTLSRNLPEAHELRGHLALLQAQASPSTPDGQLKSVSLYRAAVKYLRNALAYGAAQNSNFFLRLALAEYGALEDAAAEQSFRKAASFDDVDPTVWPAFERFGRLTGRQRAFEEAFADRVATLRVRGSEGQLELSAMQDWMNRVEAARNEH